MQSSTGTKNRNRAALRAAAPIMVGYLALGIPCGILGVKAGMSVLQVALLSVVLYAGAGQYMIASMWMAGIAPLTLALSVALVNARQLLYGFALLPYFRGEGRGRQFMAASNVTDESFGVNIARCEEQAAGAGGGADGVGEVPVSWDSGQVFRVNLCSHCSWVLANIAGALLGSVVTVDTALAAFAMTAIFICLLLMQQLTVPNIVAAVVAMLVVVAMKLCGLAQLAILVGALAGVAAGIIAHRCLPTAAGS
jgi:4-azaleucine resistance transporter AzlC